MADLERQAKRRLAALKKANEVRAQMLRLREGAKRGEIDAIAVIRGDVEEWEPLIEKWTLEKLLRLVPGLGPVTAQEVFEVGRFSPTMRVRALNPDRRKELARLCAQGERVKVYRDALR